MEELPADPSLVERVAENHIGNGRFLFNTELRSMTLDECFEAVVADGTNTILLIPEEKVNIDHQLRISASKLGMNNRALKEKTLKRVALDNISGTSHVRKKNSIGC